jgi:hypothetical protein
MFEVRTTCAPVNIGVKGFVNPREVVGVQSRGKGRESGEAARDSFTGVKKRLGSRQFKHWVPNRTKRKLMLGEDIGLEDTVSPRAFYPSREVLLQEHV